MIIKKTEGQTLITIFKSGMVVIALCSSLGLHDVAEATFAEIDKSIDTLISMAKNGNNEEVYLPMEGAESQLLYFTEPAPDGKDTLHRYIQYYVAGEEGALGLYDAAQRQILDNRYQGIMVLPYAFALKENDHWRFYSQDDLTLLSDEKWDEVLPEIDSRGKYSTLLIGVSRDGMYGAVDQYGHTVIEPVWDEYHPNTFNTSWPISRVKKDGYYGYINSEGEVVIKVRYEYAAMDTLIDPETEEETQVIYVYRDGDWGGIVKDEHGNASSVDWDIKPSEQYQAENTPE